MVLHKETKNPLIFDGMKSQKIEIGAEPMILTKSNLTFQEFPLLEYLRQFPSLLFWLAWCSKFQEMIVNVTKQETKASWVADSSQLINWFSMITYPIKKHVSFSKEPFQTNLTKQIIWGRYIQQFSAKRILTES